VQLLYKVFIHSKLYENAMKDLECRRYFFSRLCRVKKSTMGTITMLCAKKKHMAK
jgi:hypothetical protein